MLADDGSYALPDTPKGMIVFWWNDRPVAHRWMTGGAPEPLAGQIDSQVLARIAAEERRVASAQLEASVVICTRDRPDELRRCLASLPNQTWQAREVIVVDNASIDRRTRDVAHAAGAIYLLEDRPGLDIARNTGARRATSPIVAYTDDDVVLHQGWLERLVAAFDDPHIGGGDRSRAARRAGHRSPASFRDPLELWSRLQSQGFRYSAFSAHETGVFPAWKVGAGASMAFRRKMFNLVGYFDERLDVGQAGCSGDSEFWYRLLAKGFSCRYEPSSVAFHFHRRTMEGLSSQIFHYMRGHAAALLVQYERTGIVSNRIQAFLRMPRWYCRGLWGDYAGSHFGIGFLRKRSWGIFLD